MSRTWIAWWPALALLLGCGPTPAPAESPAEPQQLSPHRTAAGVLFSYEAPEGTHSVHLAGEFNGWSMTETPMGDGDGDGVWTVAVPLEDGRWEYKFVVNGSRWVTDPHAHDTNPDNYDNGVVWIGIDRPKATERPPVESAWSDDPELAPHPVEGGMLFSYRAPGVTRSVHLAGEFNHWSMNRDAMRDEDADGVWRILYPLDVGRRYEYKFVVDGTEWVTDPNAPEINRSNFDNGVVTHLPPGVPYAVRVQPAYGSRVEALAPVSAKLMCYGDRIDPASVEVRLDSRRLDHEYDASSGEISALLPGNVNDGQYTLTFSARSVGAGKPGETAVPFTLDRTPPVFESPDFYDAAVVYEIFVRSFEDSDGDGIGDLNGITRRLDYLNDGDPDTDGDLGIDVIWMMPVCQSPSYHGYDITDYYTIEGDYGTNEDFFALCREAHARGIRIVFDYVVNHSSNQHPFLRDAYGNPGSKYSAWYRFTNPEQTKYEGFAGWEGMPLLNFDSREMRDYITRMAYFWMDPNGDGDFHDGVDGFRCDVAKGPPHDWWKELRASVKSVRRDFLLFGEVWDGSPAVLDEYFDEEYDMQFDYPLYYKFLGLLNNGAIDDFDWMLEQERVTYPPESQVCRFLDNHDNDRTLSAVGGDEALDRLGVLILMTLPGTPMLYYGEEIGMEGVNPPDERIRRPMEWDTLERQKEDPGSLFHWHRRLVHLRKRYASLTARHDARTVSYRRVETDEDAVYAYLRSSGDETPLLVVCNLSRKPIERCTLALEASDLPPGEYRLQEVFPETRAFHRLGIREHGGFAVVLPGRLDTRAGIVISLER